MRGRFRFLIIAIGNAPGRTYLVPLLVIPAVLSGWLVGLIVLPGPQDRFVRWLSLLAAAAGLTAFVGGVVVDALSLRHRYPPLVVAGGGLCVLLSAFCLWREPTGVVLFRLGLPLLLTALMWFYAFYFSMFHGKQRVSQLHIGDRFPDFALPDSEGRVVTLASMLANGPALTLFYKGDW
jgi:hypothetical protein